MRTSKRKPFHANLEHSHERQTHQKPKRRHDQNGISSPKIQCEPSYNKNRTTTKVPPASLVPHSSKPTPNNKRRIKMPNKKTQGHKSSGLHPNINTTPKLNPAHIGDNHNNPSQLSPSNATRLSQGFSCSFWNTVVVWQ